MEPINRKKPQAGHTELINIEKLGSMIIGNWYYFLICIVLSVVSVYFYLQHTLPTYRVSTTILIEDDDNAGIIGPDNLLQGIGLRSGTRNLDNQIDILSSRTLIRKTLGELPFDIDCYRKQLFQRVSFYPLDPIDVVPQFESFNSYNQEFSVKPIINDMFVLTVKEDPFVKFDTIVSFGSKISFHGGTLTILPNPGILNLLDSRNKVHFIIRDMESLVEEFRKRLQIETTSVDGTIVRVVLESTNKTKDRIFLDKLSEVYIASQLEKKNREANRIIDFIDEQLVDVSDSLVITENRLQEFRSKNRIMDISAQAQQIIDQAVVLENEKARLKIVSNYFTYLSEYLSAENIQEAPISPSTMDIEDPLLGMLVQELAGLQAEYYSREFGAKNPVQAQLKQKMENTKRSLREILHGLQRANMMARDENNAQIRSLNVEASGLPVKERQLLGIEREFNLNNVLYTFLLQRRAEAQIQKASNKPDIELVDPATADLLPIAPKKAIVFLLAMAIGLGIPFIILRLGDSIKNKISSEEDIHMLTNLPLVGHIPHSRLSYNTVVLNESQSRIAEAFRSLRTRMEFFTRETQSPIILISSTMPGEGKTFTAINLASAYSLAGKRTLLVGFDLRRPNLQTSFALNGEVGLTTYLIGKNYVEDIIFETDFQNLSVIPSGPIPPNPGELSSSEKIEHLFNRLKEDYDYIIIDSAPIGAVSDGYTAASIADANIIIVRHGKTVKRFLKATLSDAQANGVKGLSLLVNDFRSKRSSYRYTYNYKYKHKK